jgi:hypothetical protein
MERCNIVNMNPPQFLACLLAVDIRFALKLYLLMAVFYGFIPLAILNGKWIAGVVQVVCIIGALVVTWRLLAKRRLGLDRRIELAFVTYVVTTLVTNLVFMWYYRHGAS